MLYDSSRREVSLLVVGSAQNVQMIVDLVWLVQRFGYVQVKLGVIERYGETARLRCGDS